MFPNDPNQPNGPTLPPPQTVFNPAPVQQVNNQYQAVPPPPTGGNNGHSGHNPYEFIMSPGTAKKRPFSLGGSGDGKSFLIRIGLILGGVAVIMIGAAVIISSLAPKGSGPGLTAIAERQQEIIRVATAATDQTTGQDTANFVANVQASTTSSQHQVLGYLAAHGTKVSPAQLKLDQNSQTDTLLANASATNYDVTVDQNLTSQLKTYQTLLQTTYNQTSGTVAKKLLQDCFDGATLLLKQAEALPANSNT